VGLGGWRCGPFFWSGTFGDHLFYTDDFVVYLLGGHSDDLYRNIARQMPDKCFNRFIRLCVKCKEVEIFLSGEFLYGVAVGHTFSCYPGSGCSVP
jgi:hypothetical protein